MDAFREIRRIIAEGTCIVGLGNDLRSDDGAGAYIARALKGAVPGPGGCVINAEDIIEGYAFTIAGMECGNVLLVDAVEAHREAGSLVFGRYGDIAGASVNFSTHKLSLSLAVDIIERSGKEVYLLGIVPATTDFGIGMGWAVKKSADIIIDFITDCVNHYQKEYAYEC